MTKLCWICGNDSEIEMHHMLPPALNPIRNIEVPLCGKCHDKVHAYYGRHNSPKYLKEVKRLSDQLRYYKSRTNELEVKINGNIIQKK